MKLFQDFQIPLQISVCSPQILSFDTSSLVMDGAMALMSAIISLLDFLYGELTLLFRSFRDISSAVVFSGFSISSINLVNGHVLVQPVRFLSPPWPPPPLLDLVFHFSNQFHQQLQWADFSISSIKFVNVSSFSLFHFFNQIHQR